MKIGAIFILTILIFFSGILIHNIVVLDSSFALGYFLLDTVGFWRGGPQWVEDNRFLAIVCLLIIPIFVSTLFATFVVVIFNALRTRSLYLSFLFLLLFFVLIFGLQSRPENRISYFKYAAINY